VIGSAVIATMENNLKKLVQYLERALQITQIKFEAALLQLKIPTLHSALCPKLNYSN